MHVNHVVCVTLSLERRGSDEAMVDGIFGYPVSPNLESQSMREYAEGCSSKLPNENYELEETLS
jgi:hypothetical protein